MAMRTSIFALVTLLIIVAGLLVSCGSPDAVKYRYEAEKRLHQAEKMAEDAGIRGTAREPETNRRIRSAFGEAMQYAYTALKTVDQETDSTEYRQLSGIALRSAARLSQYFFAMRQFDTCVVILNNLLSEISLSPVETGAAWVNLGQALQASGRWDSATVVYNRATELVNPPVEANGDVIISVFSLPAHIYRVNERVGDSAAARAQFDEARQYYERFTRQYAGTKLGLGSHAMLASLYTSRKQWPQALAALQQLRDSSGELSWEAQSRMADIYAMQTKEYDRAMNLYSEVLSRLQDRDTLARPALLFKQAIVLAEQKKYEQARQMLTNLSRDYRYYYTQNPAPQYIKAKTFEMEGNWERAETEYRFLIENYAGTEQAMSAYLYLGEQLNQRGRAVEAKQWMERADTYFADIASRYPGSQAEARALTYRAELLRRNEQWPEASEMLLQIFEKFPDTQIGQRAALAAAGITREKLNDPVAADSLVQALKKTMTSTEETTES